MHRHRTTNELDVLRPPPDAAAGTHASDHNAVYLIRNRTSSDQARKRRRQKAERRRRREELDAEGKDKDKDGSGVPRYNRSQTQSHELAFFYPVPLWIGFGSCVTVPFVVNSPCAIVSVLFFSVSVSYVARLADESGVRASRAQWEGVWQHVRDRCVQAGVVVAHAVAAVFGMVVDAGAAHVVEVVVEADTSSHHSSCIIMIMAEYGYSVSLDSLALP